MTTLSTTAGMPPTAAEGHDMRSPIAALPQLLRCAVVSWYPLRGDCLRVVAEQEQWQTMVCGNAKELRQCLFRNDIPLAIVDLPKASSDDYVSFRKLTEWLSERAKWNGTSGILLVVCAAGESVQEEIWARQLGIWSYLPHVQLPARAVQAVRKVAAIESPHPRDREEKTGLSLLFSEARMVLAKKTQTTQEIVKEPGQYG